MDGWTAGEQRRIEAYRGESIYDPRPEDEERLSEREEPEEEAAPEELEVEQTESDVPKVQVNAPACRADRVPTFELTGAQWDALLARACKPAGGAPDGAGGMRTWAQRQWEAEQYEPAPEECLDCHGPILDRGDQHWPSACHCPRCDWCGAHDAALETVMVDDDEVCRACRAAEAR